MQEGVAPHASIIFILGQLSISNMKVFFRISKDIFKYLLSILPVTKTDNMRKTYAASKIENFLLFITQFSEFNLFFRRSRSNFIGNERILFRIKSLIFFRTIISIMRKGGKGAFPEPSYLRNLLEPSNTSDKITPTSPAPSIH